MIPGLRRFEKIRIAELMAVAACAIASGACTVFTPPTRALPLETAATLGKGRTGEQVEVGRALQYQDFPAESGALRVRHGIAKDTDVSVEGTAISVASDKSDPRSVGSLHVWSGRAGIKHRVAPGLAIGAGLGGGAFAKNVFVGPDVAVSSFENPSVIPFVALRGATSVPIAPHQVYFGDGTATPTTVWYAQLALGVRVPIGAMEAKRGDLRGSVLAGFGKTWLVAREAGAFDGFALGGEITF